MILHKWTRPVLLSLAAAVLLSSACVVVDSSSDGDGGSILGSTSGGVKYFQLLDGSFQTKFFDNLPFEDGPTYVFSEGELMTVFDFFGNGELLLDFETGTPGRITVDGQEAPVFPGAARVIRGGVALGFGANVAGNTLTDATQDFFASVDVGDTVEIESGSGAVPGQYTVINVSATVLTLDRSAGDSGGSGDVIYNVRNDGDSVIVRFDFVINNPDGSVRSLNVGLMLDFSYDGLSLVGDFDSMSVTTLGAVVQEELESGMKNIALRKVEDEDSSPLIPTSQPAG